MAQPQGWLHHCQRWRLWAVSSQLSAGIMNCLCALSPIPGEGLCMGQYQDGCLDKMGTVMELAHRNSSQCLSWCLVKGAVLWNNPSIGRVSFARNMTECMRKQHQGIDWITSGTQQHCEKLRFRHRLCADDAGLCDGFWQCKLRYRTQKAVEHSRNTSGVCRCRHRGGLLSLALPGRLAL